MFHIFHDWITFRIFLTRNREEKLRICSGCGRMEQIASAGIEGAMWIPDSMDNYSREDQNRICNRILKGLP
jgi:hypothetical protein